VTTGCKSFLRIGLAAAILAAIAASLAFLPVPQDLSWLQWFLEQIRSLGPWGPVCFVVLYAIVCLLLLPGSVLTAAGGFMFGVVWGAVTASLGATLGATAAFLIARWILRGWIEHWFPAHPKFRAVDRAIGRQGFTVVFLTRLSSLLPYDLSSYLFGLTNVPLGRYVLATWLGRLPETLLWAYVGSTAKSLTSLATGEVELGIGRKIFLAVGLVAMAAAAAIVIHIARKALRELVDNHSTFDEKNP
jgi:uncharacterized membrane protein YdjX (TVP38/TMEM64 family)